MSKFEQLCNAYKSRRDEFFQLRNEAIDFASSIYIGFQEYLDVPDGYAKPVPLNNYRPDTQYNIPGSISLEEDGHWHFGMIITFYMAENIFPQQSVFIDVKFKIIDNGYVVSLGPLPKKFTILSKNDHHQFYGYLYDTINDHWKGSVRDILNGSTQTSIGFIRS